MEINDSSRTQDLHAEQLRRRFQAIFHNTFQFIFLASVEGTVIEINQAALKFIGLHAHEALGKMLWDLPCWGEEESIINKLKTSIYRASGGEFIRYTIEVYSSEGVAAIVDFSIKPIFSDVGDVDFFVVEGRDITTIKKMEFERNREREHAETLQKLNDMKNEFVSKVSHELRTPLASIIGFAQTLLRSPHLDIEKQQKFLTIILDDGRRLGRLVEDLLDVSRIESGHLRLVKDTVDVRIILEYAITILTEEASSNHIRLEFAASPNVQSTILIDKDRITQVFVNLLDNAVKFTPQHGTVTISLSNQAPSNQAPSNQLFIGITDTGIGIPSEELPRLFTKFYRVRQSGEQIRGTGLGLSIAKQLVELHGGTISVHSIVGQGSTFLVSLPLD